MTSPLLFSGPDTVVSGRAEGWGDLGARRALRAPPGPCPSVPGAQGEWGTAAPCHLCSVSDQKSAVTLSLGRGFPDSERSAGSRAGCLCPGGSVSCVGAGARRAALLCSPYTRRNEAVARWPALLHCRSGAGGQDPTPAAQAARTGRRTMLATDLPPPLLWAREPGPPPDWAAPQHSFVHGLSRRRTFYACHVRDDGLLRSIN